MKKFLVFIGVLLLLAGIGGCKSKDAEAPVIGEMDYQLVDTSSAQFEELNQGDFSRWYEQNYKEPGCYILKVKDQLYILISAGEKQAAGYILNNLRLTGKEDVIEAEINLIEPDLEQAATQTVTYPHFLAVIAYDRRPVSLADINGIPAVSAERIEQAAGVYIGRIDSNSIEIRVEGNEARAFAVNSSVQEKIENGEIQDGDQVSFQYITGHDDDPQLSIVSMKKIVSE